jgi:hypothetical protein
MATKDELKRRPQQKLTLSKETIRDLTPKQSTVDTVRGGLARSGGNNCSYAYTQDHGSCGY